MEHVLWSTKEKFEWKRVQVQCVVAIVATEWANAKRKISKTTHTYTQYEYFKDWSIRFNFKKIDGVRATARFESVKKNSFQV